MYKSKTNEVKLEQTINTIESERPFIKRYGSKLLFIIVSAIFLLITCINAREKEKFIQLEISHKRLIDSLQTVQFNQSIEKKSGKSFTEENLVTYLNEINIKFPDVVLAQAKLESGNFTSYLFRVNNNLFGMKKAGQRPTTTISVNKKHAVYKNWQESVLDYALLQSTILPKVKTKKQYIAYIGKNYAELPHGEYEKLLNKFLESSARE